jgi:hypothetical protein
MDQETLYPIPFWKAITQNMKHEEKDKKSPHRRSAQAEKAMKGMISIVHTAEASVRGCRIISTARGAR